MITQTPCAGARDQGRTEEGPVTLPAQLAGKLRGEESLHGPAV